MIYSNPMRNTKYTAYSLFILFFCISIHFVFSPISPFVEVAPKIVHFFFDNYPFLRMVSKTDFQQYVYVSSLAIQWVSAYLCFWVFMSLPALLLTLVSLKLLKFENLRAGVKPLIDIYAGAFFFVLFFTLASFSIALICS